FFGPKFFRLVIRANENDTVPTDRDGFSAQLFFVNGVNVAVNEGCVGRFRGGSDAAHEQQNSSDSAHHRTVSVIPCENASRVRETPVRLGRKFFLPSSGVFIESAHNVSAARATLTICS